MCKESSIHKRSPHLFFLTFFLLFLSGCWDRVEINDLAIVTGAAIDQNKEGQIELSVQVFIPKTLGGGGGQSGGGGGSKLTYTATQTGENIMDALSKLQGKFPRELFWGQCKVFIFGEELAKKGIQKQLDFFLRHPEPRGRASVFVSEGPAKAVLELEANLEMYSAEVLRELSDYRTGAQTTIQDLDKMLTGISRAASIPCVKVKAQQPTEGKPVKYVHIEGTAVFKRDKMVGTISEAETRGVLWIKNEIKDYTISVEMEGKENEKVSLNPVSARVNLVPSIQGHKWKMEIDIDTEGMLVQNETSTSYDNEELLKKVEQAYARNIETRIEEVLKVLQRKINADIVDFSKKFYQKYPKERETIENHWDKLFPEVEVNIKVKAHIRRNGYINEPGAMPDNEIKR